MRDHQTETKIHHQIFDVECTMYTRAAGNNRHLYCYIFVLNLSKQNPKINNFLPYNSHMLVKSTYSYNWLDNKQKCWYSI